MIGIDLKKAFKHYHEYENCVADLLKHPQIQSMAQYIHHSNVTCLDHSLHVSYKAFRTCKRLGLDYKSAARGALLHDFFCMTGMYTKQEEGCMALYTRK